MTKLLATSSRGIAESPTSEPSDEALLLRYRSCGDRKAFAELVHRYERHLYNYLCRYLDDPSLAEDVFQMTFLQVHLKCGQFDETRAFRPWLYTIAMNQAIDEQRRNKRHYAVSLDRPRRTDDGDGDESSSLTPLLAGRECDPSGNVETAHSVAWVRDAVGDLPEVLRTSLVLVYYQGMKYREAAEVLNVPVGTVKSRVHSALLKLTKEWQAAESDVPN